MVYRLSALHLSVTLVSMICKSCGCEFTPKRFDAATNISGDDHLYGLRPCVGLLCD